MGEFDLIRHYFEERSAQFGNAPWLELGIGDDGALMKVPEGEQLVVSTDMLVEGRHFFHDVDPVALGHKSLAVNLSDLAAMGAKPLGFTLALALPRVDEQWLDAYSSGLLSLASAAGCALVGGDTTQGPLNICITVMGRVPAGNALRRDAARVGDDIWVSGYPGEARAALGVLRDEVWARPLHTEQHWPVLRERLERPTPRLALGAGLAGVAHAAIDISDGLASDLTHILKKSGVGATIATMALPLRETLKALDSVAVRECLLNGGDDYELLFTASPKDRRTVLQIAEAARTPVTRIGSITPASDGLRERAADDTERPLQSRGYDHFGANTDAARG